MKKTMASLLFMLISLGLVTAGDISVYNVSTESSCDPSQSVDVNFYLTSNGVLTQPYDTFKSTNSIDLLIGNNSSSVEIWRHGVISNCAEWNRVSLVAKGNNSNRVLAILNAGDCRFNIPTDPNYISRKMNHPTAIDAQIHFTIGYKTLSSTRNSNHPKANKLQSRLYYKYSIGGNWICYPNGSSVTNSNNCTQVTRYYSNQTYSHTGECRNYRVFWCGDGLVNSPYGTSYDNGTYIEECDPQASGWNEETCNPSTCKINPQCNSQYNGSGYYTLFYTGSWLNSSMSTLCTNGTVTSFQPNPIPTNPTSPIQYTWSCTTTGGETTGCNAVQMWCGDGVIQTQYGEQCEPGLPINENNSPLDYLKDLLSQHGYSGGKGTNSSSMLTNATSTRSESGYSCNSLCQLVQNPQCSSEYSGVQYTISYTGPWLNPQIAGLCSGGTVTGFSSNPSPIPTNPTSPISYTWSCTTGGITITGCNAAQQWCGDGQLNGSEQCDPNDSTHQGWGNGGCSNTCQPVIVNPQCNSQYNGQVIYTGDSTPYLNQWMTALCTDGSVTDFQYTGTPIQYTWSCTTGGVTVTGCNAVQQWCGDGQLQTNYGEQCDPNDSTHQGWGNGGCSNTCQPVTVNPQCNSQYNGQVIYTGGSTPYLNQWMTTLCTDGAVTDFQYTGTPIQYIWSCTTGGVTVTGCNAAQQWCGDGQLQTNYGEQCDPNDPNHTGWGDGCSNTCQPTTTPPPPSTGHLVIDKTLVGSGLISNTGDAVVWKIRVTAVSGDVTNFTIKDILPSILGYTNFNVLHNPGLNISNPTTTQTVNGLEIKWNVVGTLTQGNYIEIQVNTYATQMPNSQNVYENVGCVTYDDTEICDSESIPGHLEIDKSVVGSGLITHTGDTIKWRIRVTAVGGDVTPVTFKDYLPSILDYYSYTVIHNGGLTVNNPTITSIATGHEIKWTTVGTLHAGDYVEIELITVANAVQTGSYRNVACVIQNTGEETCDPVVVVRTGHLEIDKSVVGSGLISNTGDAVVWKIRVTAVSGDVTNFTIKDVLPSILGYTDSYVLHNPGLNISNPTTMQTTNGLEIKWDVVGTLTEGNYIEIQIDTYATQMPNPRTTYKNVGCVTYNDTEICDQEPIPGHLEIEKILIGSGLISHTGEIVTWRIRVTAVGESFSGFEIVDRLPSILSYNSFTVIHAGGLTISNPTILGNEITWTPLGTLNTGDYVEIELHTIANGMPQGGYVNVACVKPNPNEEDCSTVHVGSLKIEKTLVGDRIITNTGDIITWNIVVTALSGDVTNPIITDMLPSILSYSGYSVIISGGLNVSSPIISGNEIIWNTQGVLTEGNQIVIRVITSVEEMPDHDYDNVACVKYDENGEPVICDNESVPAPKLRIKKRFIDGSTGKQVNVGDTIVYKIEFGNSGDASATITSIKDFLPNTVEFTESAIFISGTYVSEYMTGWSGAVHSGHSVQGVYVDIFTGITLNPGDSGYIILTGRVLTGTNQDNRTNFACIYLNDNNIDCDDVTHEYGSLMCMPPVIATNSFSNAGGSTTVTCKTSPQGSNADLIELDCGNGTILSGTNISELSGTCTYPSNSSSSVVSYTVKCTVNGTGNCQGTVTVDKRGGGGGNDPYCTKPEISRNQEKVAQVTCKTDNGRRADIKIDCGYNGQVYTSSGRVELFTGICDYTGVPNGEYKVECYANGKTLSNCNDIVKFGGGGGGGGGGGSDPIYDQAECFNVNTNQVSIEQGEILPFFWNIKNVKNIKDWAVVLDDGDNAFKDKVQDITIDVVKKYEGKSCDENNSIALNSMICKFKIKNGKEIVKEAQFPCLRDTHGRGENWVSDIKLLDAWMRYWKTYYQGNSGHFFRSFSNKDRTYALRSNLNYIENFGMDQEWLGEYKISLTDIQYLQCRDNKWTVQHPDINRCENDFTVTNSYTVQKTPSGNLKASTVTLSKYLYMDGKDVFKMSNLLNAIATTEYEPNNTVSETMQSFKNKYEKLAVNIGGDMKKVPGKSIYFIEGNKTIRDGDFTKPVTFIQTNPNSTITIKGSITNLNMMILTEGTIKFEDTNSCNNRQVVKGIFYAGSKLIRTPVDKNTSLSNDKWCTGGGLTIKGVLIGKGLNQMMKDSRSNLNGWFYANSDSQKKRVVMDGASVLIEYSPSVFTTATMPPGAEYFTTALSIYKN